MSTLVLPAGQSLRQIAGRLGVPIDELKRHAGLDDVEQPLATERQIDVPDGFLRSHKRAVELTDAMSAPSAKRGGMNSWLALDIERKRAYIARDLGSKRVAEVEHEALLEARRAYLRFEAASNTLAGELYAQLAQSHLPDVRALALTGKCIAEAQAHHLFAEPPGPARARALSTAKAAILADPKLAEARLGMAMALGIAANASALAESKAELELAVGLGPSSAWVQTYLGSIARQLGSVDEAATCAHLALELDGDYPLGLELAAHLAVDEGELELAAALLARAVGATPTFAGGHLHLAVCLHRLGREAEAATSLAQAHEHATSEVHGAWIDAEFRMRTEDHSR